MKFHQSTCTQGLKTPRPVGRRPWHNLWKGVVSNTYWTLNPRQKSPHFPVQFGLLSPLVVISNLVLTPETSPLSPAPPPTQKDSYFPLQRQKRNHPMEALLVFCHQTTHLPAFLHPSCSVGGDMSSASVQDLLLQWPRSQSPAKGHTHTLQTFVPAVPDAWKSLLHPPQALPPLFLCLMPT